MHLHKQKNNQTAAAINNGANQHAGNPNFVDNRSIAQQNLQLKSIAQLASPGSIFSDNSNLAYSSVLQLEGLDQKKIDADKKSLTQYSNQIRNRLFEYGYAMVGANYTNATPLLTKIKSYADQTDADKLDAALVIWETIRTTWIDVDVQPDDDNNRTAAVNQISSAFLDIQDFTQKYPHNKDLPNYWIKIFQGNILVHDDNFGLIKGTSNYTKILNGDGLEAMNKAQFVQYATNKLQTLEQEDASKQDRKQLIESKYKEIFDEEKAYADISGGIKTDITHIINRCQDLAGIYGIKNVYNAIQEVGKAKDAIREQIQQSEGIYYQAYNPDAASEADGDLQDFANKSKASIDQLITDNPTLKKGQGKKGEKTKAAMQLLEDGTVLDHFNYALFVSGGANTSAFNYDEDKSTKQGLGGDDSLKDLTYEAGHGAHVHARDNDTEVKILERTLRFLKDNNEKDFTKMELRVFVSRYTCPSCSDLFYKSKQEHNELKQLGTINIVYTENAF